MGTIDAPERMPEKWEECLELENAKNAGPVNCSGCGRACEGITIGASDRNRMTYCEWCIREQFATERAEEWATLVILRKLDRVRVRDHDVWVLAEPEQFSAYDKERPEAPVWVRIEPHAVAGVLARINAVEPIDPSEDWEPVAPRA
jgi:hypothetical protein